MGLLDPILNLIRILSLEDASVYLRIVKNDDIYSEFVYIRNIKRF